MSKDKDLIYQFNSQKDSQKRAKDVKKLKDFPQDFITFIQFYDRSRKSNYKFYGIFTFKNSKDDLNQIMIYEKISDEFSFNF
ncbi:hypothetical protein [Spiroplasma taiwanense]|uniref:hypothetical protein n=1 Tax=Spiroplasma taiwanense TaxID=2145 RepID=UPI001469E01B